MLRRRTTHITGLRPVMLPFKKRTDRNSGACDCSSALIRGVSMSVSIEDIAKIADVRTIIANAKIEGAKIYGDNEIVLIDSEFSNTTFVTGSVQLSLPSHQEPE